MKSLTLELENCYGIKKLDHHFDFEEQRVFAIYAPNGAMKSSLAQAFKDVRDSVASKDRIFPARLCTRRITDEGGSELPAECVLVVPPYDEHFAHTEKTSTLLVNAQLRREYENLHKDIESSKALLLSALKVQSGSKKNLEREISSTFTKSDEQFITALVRIETELLAQRETPFADLHYDIIFDEKVIGFLGTKDFKTAIEDYVTKYNELLAASTYFKKGTFNYYNAASIAKNLADNGFFDAKHSVSLNADARLEITSQKQLEQLIAKEKEGISSDNELRKKFAEIEKLLTKNVNVRSFENYLGANAAILPKLANLESFREEVWKSYLLSNVDLYKDLLSKYRASERRKNEIEEEARKERTQWEGVIDIFNARFLVPFKLVAKNRVSVILGDEPLLSLGFVFEDDGETTSVEKLTLMQSLSTGEKKALYVLNIIFEIETRKKAGQETILIIDDVADSFDYKNKYAIIQYLKEIADNASFKQIILTHNFDFFRTINSRFVKRQACLVARKGRSSLMLEPAVGLKNVFTKDWKPRFFDDSKKRIACIPFMRNLIEYTKGSTDPGYLRLTSLLHWKDDSDAIVQKDLDEIYRSVFGGIGEFPNQDAKVSDLIFTTAGECLTANEGVNFENKIVLSIAIRLTADRFMITKINDASFSSTITSNQTPKLLSRFQTQFASEAKSIAVLSRVILMTPESIHLNSFMYEPIVDMSDEHLRVLYMDIVALS